MKQVISATLVVVCIVVTLYIYNHVKWTQFPRPTHLTVDPKHNSSTRYHYNSCNCTKQTKKLQNGYIIVNTLSGQQGSGARALVALQCWVKSFLLPVYIVEPFISGSKFVTSGLTTGMLNSSKVMRFSDIFDMRNFNNVSLEEGMPPLVSWEDFIKNAPRNVIVGDISHGRTYCEKKVTIQQDHNYTKVEWVPEWLSEEAFSIVRVVKLQGCLSNASAPTQMFNMLYEGWDPSNVTLLFRIWTGYAHNVIQNPNARPQLNCEQIVTAIENKDKHRFLPSMRLVDDAQYYINTFLKSRIRVAVMIRAEHAVRDYNAMYKNYDHALLALKRGVVQTVTLAKSTASRFGDKMGVSLALDVGKYGSSSWSRDNMAVQMAKNVVQDLYDGRWTFTQWENSYSLAARGAENPGYIASLQRTIASQADCLILMGGGRYQELVLTNYLENHSQPSQWCIHFMCMNQKIKETFQKVLDNHAV